MASKPDYRCGDLGSFPRKGGYVFAFQFFEGSNEETMGGQQKEKVLCVVKHHLRGRGL